MTGCLAWCQRCAFYCLFASGAFSKAVLASLRFRVTLPVRKTEDWLQVGPAGANGTFRSKLIKFLGNRLIHFRLLIVEPNFLRFPVYMYCSLTPKKHRIYTQLNRSLTSIQLRRFRLAIHPIMVGLDTIMMARC